MASRKRPRTANRTGISTYFDQENPDPGEVSSPPTKKWKSFPDFQTPTTPPLGTKDNNVSSYLQDKPQPHSVDLNDKELKSTTGEEGLNQGQKAQLSKESPDSTLLSTERVDNYFPKIHKPHSPRSKQHQTLESDEDFLSLLKEIGISVCKIVVSDVYNKYKLGTGFVWFGRFILTNAHLFRGFTDGRKLLGHIKVSVSFELKAMSLSYTAKKTFVDIDEKLDYAVFKLKPEEPAAEKVEVPPGLLKRLGTVQKSGRIGLIGYPEGEGKTFRDTFIIEEENRERAMNDHLAQYNGLIMTKESIKQIIMNQGIYEIMMGGTKQKKVITYCSSMYGATSGSPVIDGGGRLIGLHTGGYDYGYKGTKKCVIEFASPLPVIFKSFVSNLKKNGEKQLLERIRVEGLYNDYIKWLMLDDK